MPPVLLCDARGCAEPPVIERTAHTSHGGLDTLGAVCAWHLYEMFAVPGSGSYLKRLWLKPLDADRPWLPPGVTDPSTVYGPEWKAAMMLGEGFPPAGPEWKPDRPPGVAPAPARRRRR